MNNGLLLYKTSDLTTAQRVQKLKAYFSKAGTITRGAAHWSAGNKLNPSDYDMTNYDVIITGDLKIFVNKRQPWIPKAHTYMRNTGTVGVSLAGMHGMNSQIWEKHMFNDKKYPTMVNRAQFEAMAFIFAFLSHHYKFPVNNIKTHAEYATESYPLYPRGYFPDRWDLWKVGPELRGKIEWYLHKVAEVY